MGKLLKNLEVDDSFYYVDKKTFQIIYYTYIYAYLDKATSQEFYLFKEKFNNILYNFDYVETRDILNVSFDNYSDALLYLKSILESYLEKINSRIVKSV